MFDYLETDNQRGGAIIRILTFDLENKLIEVKTYDPFKAAYLIDPYDQFTLDLLQFTDLRNEGKPALIPEFSSNSMLVLIITIPTIYLFLEQKAEIAPQWRIKGCPFFYYLKYSVF